ncbi:lytic transglycosylase domain-containing protein [Aliiroseovarius lamellibrachiae]|uniref:lytic transglycosylase domain-containing protein n=1 Tax=Aliiroseovarius lamellibrachiae TaxID=1924933 RepID=UPI001BE0B63F|nr:lytic transglycosylase domain-containing protein [Aliiroseovarius lamellibrachiae]MBT2130858.1 lytic transglycosylase domain-containing protein [Aliiroseovarius lamellibrachiae]
MRRVVTKSLLLAHLVLAISSGAVRADSAPPPFAEFTFKKVGVPSGAGKRIQVQIDPAEQAAALAVPTAEDATAPKGDGAAALKPSGYEWFWTTVSAKQDGSGPANLQRAFVALEEKEGLAAPRLQDLQDIAKVHGLNILKATVGTDVSPAWVLALISVESAGRADAISSAGAQGVMQLIPDTAARFGVEDASDPAQNIKGGVAYMAWLLKHFNGDPILAMAGYNAGENAVKDNQGVPPYPETRAYIPKVLAAWRVARGLCLTPPELLSDGCVFAVKGS